jgi:hypothetical protein
MLQRHRTPLAILLLCLLALGSAAAASALQQSPSGRRANARKLLRIADGASRRLVQAGEGRLDRNARAQPFREAIRRMDAQLGQIGAGLRTRDLSFFQALRAGTSALAEVRTTWSLSGVRDPAVDQDLRTLAAAYERLRNRYGPEWVRFQTGRPLSEDERTRFARMRAEQGYFSRRLEPLRDRAEQARDYATADQLSLLLLQVQGVAAASATLGDYLDASVATDAIRGAWYGARAAHGSDEEGWSEADQVVSDITTDESVGFVFTTTDAQTVQDWSFVEEETEVPAEIAQADERAEAEPGDTTDSSRGVILFSEEPIEEIEPAEEFETIEGDPEGVVEEPAVETEGEETGEALTEGEITGDELTGDEATGDEGAIEEEDLEILPVIVDPAAAPPAAPVPPPVPPAGSR